MNFDIETITAIAGAIFGIVAAWKTGEGRMKKVIRTLVIATEALKEIDGVDEQKVKDNILRQSLKDGTVGTLHNLVTKVKDSAKTGLPPTNIEVDMPPVQPPKA